MEYRTFKIYNEKYFDKIMNGIKVAQCMQSKSCNLLAQRRQLVTPGSFYCRGCYLIFENYALLRLHCSTRKEYVVSDSLSCSFCNTIFENKVQQRLHYKLDWHRYNLKQRLLDLKSVTEDEFVLLADKDDASSLSGSEIESEIEDETSNPENGGSPLGEAKGETDGKSTTPGRSKNSEKNTKQSGSISDSFVTEVEEDVLQKKKIEAPVVVASRRSKVFFENEEGDILSIYRCLLLNNKEIHEIDNEMIAQALESPKKTLWTVIMLGGGHFAAAVFHDGKAIARKTFHSYTVRAKQGSSQSLRDMRTMGSHPKSAGAILRRYNETMLVQHIHEILESWTMYMRYCSLIFYRAVGPHNRKILFGGKNPPLDKNNPKLRRLPFVKRCATYSEVKRVFNTLSTVEIYGSARDFTDRFPISPRQPIKKRVSKVDLLEEIPEDATKTVDDSTTNDTSNSSHESGKTRRRSSLQLTSAERPHRTPRSHIKRAKLRKRLRQPLPVARLSQSSSESEHDRTDTVVIGTSPMIEQDFEIDFKDHLQAFQNTVPWHVKNRKFKRHKRKGKKERGEEFPINEVLAAAKLKLWDASKSGDTKVFSGVWDTLLAEIKRCEQLDDEANRDVEPNSIKSACLRIADVYKVINESNEDGNTMLHLAAMGGHLRLVWVLLESGSDPCNKNKKQQTPYAATPNKEMRNHFRRFMGNNPDKFDYSKSQIPGPLTEEMEEEKLEKRMKKRAKRDREKIKKTEFDVKRKEEEFRELFFSNWNKCTLHSKHNRLQLQGVLIIGRCFQCGSVIGGLERIKFYDNNFCSILCLITSWRRWKINLSNLW